MALKTIFAWGFAATSLVLWLLGMWIFFRTGRGERKTIYDQHAMREAMAMGWSEASSREVFERFPRSAGAAVVYAGHARGRRDFKEALRRYQEAIRRDPDEIRGHMFAAQMLRELGRFDEADVLLRRARRRFRSERQVYEELAWVAQRRRDFPEAVRRWEVVRKRFPTAETGYRQGADALRLAGRTAEADALLAEANLRFPPSPPAAEAEQ